MRGWHTPWSSLRCDGVIVLKFVHFFTLCLLLGRKADLGPDGFQIKICHVTYSSTFCTEAGLHKLPEYVDLFIQHHSKMTPAHKRFFEHGAVYRLWANPRNLRVCPVFHIAAFIASAGLQLEDYLFCGLHTGTS